MEAAIKEKHQFTWKEIGALIIPLIVEQALSILIGMADTMMVSKAGEAAVSAVSLIDNLSVLLTTAFSAFATGGAVIVAQYMGAGKNADAKAAAKNLIYISLGVSLIIALILVPFRRSVIDALYGMIETDVRAYAMDYLFYIALSYPFLALYSAFAALSRSERRSSRTMIVSALMNVINIGGNALLIYSYGMAAKGAAIASLVSRIVGALVMFILMMREKEILNVRGITKGPISKALIAMILKIAIPSAIEGSLFNIGKLVLMRLIATLGTSSTAIHAVICNFNSFSNIPGYAINLAIVTIVGQCRGRDNFRDIKYYTRRLIALDYLTIATVTVPLYFFAPSIIGFYGLESASAVRALPIARLCVIACSTIWPLSFGQPQMLAACGDVKFNLAASISSIWIFRIMGAYVLVKCFNMDVEAIWYGMYADWAFRAILFYGRIKSGKWKDKKVI